MQRIFFFLAFLCVAAIVSAAEPNDLFGRLNVRLLDAGGIELKTIEVAKAATPGLVRQRFLFKDKEIVLESSVDPASKTVVYRVESPHFESGEIGIGFRFPRENRLPPMSVNGNRITFECKRGTTLIGWADAATTVKLTAPKPRQPLYVSLAEYGANDRWKDVTETVREQIVGDVLDFRSGNALFGDPIGGVVKSLSLTFSIGDGDENLATFSENQAVRIQFDPKDQFFRLNVEKKSVFEFVVAAGLKALPEKLPTFEEARKNAATIDVPLQFNRW